MSLKAGPSQRVQVPLDYGIRASRPFLYIYVYIDIHTCIMGFGP